MQTFIHTSCLCLCWLSSWSSLDIHYILWTYRNTQRLLPTKQNSVSLQQVFVSSKLLHKVVSILTLHVLSLLCLVTNAFKFHPFRGCWCGEWVWKRSIRLPIRWGLKTRFVLSQLLKPHEERYGYCASFCCQILAADGNLLDYKRWWSPFVCNGKHLYDITPAILFFKWNNIFVGYYDPWLLIDNDFFFFMGELIDVSAKTKSRHRRSESTGQPNLTEFSDGLCTQLGKKTRTLDNFILRKISCIFECNNCWLDEAVTSIEAKSLGFMFKWHEAPYCKQADGQDLFLCCTVTYLCRHLRRPH